MKHITAAALAASVAIIPAERAAADAGDFLGGVVAGAIGSAIVNQNRQRTRTVYRSAPKRSGISAATRAANRDTQNALNYFGFNAGGADGVLGRRSRSAISGYQAHLGYNPTGQLTDFERTFLIGSWNRALAGGPATTQLILAEPTGPRGLLTRWRAEAAGVPVQPAFPQQQLASAAPAAPVAPSAAETAATNAANAATAAATAATAAVTASVAPDGAEAAAVDAGTVEVAKSSNALPNFLGDTGGASLASHCNKISLLTNSNGGFTTLASMTDGGFVLNEQFCLARTYAMAESEELSTKVQGFTSAQMAEQCAAFGPAMAEYVSALSLRPQEEVVRDVSTFVLNSGMSPAQLSGTAKICLGVGYRTDDMDVALGSALLLVTLGETAYAELPGHHLAQGFGTSTRADLAATWYASATEALTTGGAPAFVPGQSDRAALIDAAVTDLTGGTAPLAPVEPTDAALPSFAISE